MLYTQNGNLGKLSVMGLGCWNFGGQCNKVKESDAIEIIRYAIDNGINYVDVAESYGVPDGQCEMILGKALKDGYRDKVFIVSKVGWYGRRTADCLNAKDSLYTKLMRKVFNKLNHYKTVDLATRTPEIIRLSGHACCGRLGTDHIDLLLCHDGNPKDPEAFIKGFRMLQNEGFIKHYGISTDSVDVLKHFYELSDGECAACECDYSLLHRNAENDIFKFCKEHDIAILTRGTLCRGLLSGKYDLDTVFKESSRQDWNLGGKNRWQYEMFIQQINKLRSNLDGASLTEISYRFAFSRQEHPSVVIGCTSMDQIKHNIEIASNYLPSCELERIESIIGGGKINKKVLLLGGTGTLSTAVLKEALSQGYDVTILNRGTTSDQLPVGVNIIICDFEDNNKLKSLIDYRSFDVVVDFLSRKPKDIERVYQLFKDRCQQYIFISTACVYRRAKEDFPIKEISPKPNVGWSYNTEKYESELKLIELSKGVSSYYTIIRPYITYNEERIPLGVAPAYKYHRTIIERLRAGKPWFVWDEGKAITTVTYVDDFAAGVVGLFLNDKAINEDFHITSDYMYTQREVVEMLFQKLNMPINIVSISSEKISELLPEYKDMLTGDRSLNAIFDNSKIKEAVPKLRFKTSLSEAIDIIINHWNAARPLYDYHFEARIDELLNSVSVESSFKSYPGASFSSKLRYYVTRYIAKK